FSVACAIERCRTWRALQTLVRHFSTHMIALIQPIPCVTKRGACQQLFLFFCRLAAGSSSGQAERNGGSRVPGERKSIEPCGVAAGEETRQKPRIAWLPELLLGGRDRKPPVLRGKRFCRRCG